MYHLTFVDYVDDNIMTASQQQRKHTSDFKGFVNSCQSTGLNKCDFLR